MASSKGEIKLKLKRMLRYQIEKVSNRKVAKNMVVNYLVTETIVTKWSSLNGPDSFRVLSFP